MVELPQLCHSFKETMGSVNLQLQLYSRILSAVLAKTGRFIDEKKVLEDNEGKGPLCIRDYWHNALRLGGPTSIG